MKSAPAFLLVLLLVGLAAWFFVSTSETGPPEMTDAEVAQNDQVYGTYDYSRIADADLPNEDWASATLEWRPDGTWTVTMTPADGSDPTVATGASTVEPGPEGCFAVTAWNPETTQWQFSGTICDGVIRGDAGSFVATKRN